MDQQAQHDRPRSAFALDPRTDKARIKANIAETIEDQIRTLDQAQVEEAVERTYEQLLAGASVMQHIPTLTEGIVKANLRHPPDET